MDIFQTNEKRKSLGGFTNFEPEREKKISFEKRKQTNCDQTKCLPTQSCTPVTTWPRGPCVSPDQCDQIWQNFTTSAKI